MLLYRYLFRNHECYYHINWSLIVRDNYYDETWNGCPRHLYITNTSLFRQGTSMPVNSKYFVPVCFATLKRLKQIDLWHSLATCDTGNSVAIHFFNVWKYDISDVRHGVYRCKMSMSGKSNIPCVDSIIPQIYTAVAILGVCQVR